jgi:tetratricopeptide (TPR) repeat protein
MRAARFARPAVVWACVWTFAAAGGLFWGCAKQVRRPPERVYLHKVDAGETLPDIAEDYYGDPERAAEIGKFNALSADAVPKGTVLRVPMTAGDIEQLGTRERARASYNEGLELVTKASYLDAVEKFREASSIDPTFADAVYNLGVTLQTMKSYQKAKEHLESAVKLRPKNAGYRFALGNSFYHLGDFSAASREFERVMEMDSGNTKALYSLAVCYEKMGEKEKAVAAWRRYLDLDATSSWAAEARKRLEALR